MGQHDNRRLTGAIYDAFNRNDLDAVIANATDDISVAYHPTGETFTGRDGFRVSAISQGEDLQSHQSQFSSSRK